MTTEQFIEKYKPCKDAEIFLNTQTDMQTAWQVCERGDWLLWALRKMNVLPKSHSVALAIAFARRCQHINTDSRVIAAIEAAQAWLDNPSKDTASAANSAYAAAHAAYAAYAASAAYAADAASAADAAAHAASAASAANSAYAAASAASAASAANSAYAAASAAYAAAHAASAASAAYAAAHAASAAEQKVQADIIRAQIQPDWERLK